jgi:hypothetical protein
MTYSHLESTISLCYTHPSKTAERVSPVAWVCSKRFSDDEGHIGETCTQKRAVVVEKL